jgi:hypothetical protein
VGRLTDWGYRQNCAELARRGFRTGEPGDIRRERSRVFGSVLSTLRQQGTTAADVAAELGLSLNELHGLTFGHAAVAVAGGGLSAAGARPNLRVVR